MRPLKRFIQTLVLMSASIAELPAQRYTDQDWIRLRSGLKAGTSEIVVTRMAPSLPMPSDSMKERVLRYACAMGAPPNLVLQIAEQESNFVSTQGQAGELGIMQVKEDTARLHGLDPARLLDVDYGIYAGIVVLLDIMREYPSEETALGVYNAGPGYATRSLNARVRSKAIQYIEQVQQRRSKYARYTCRYMP